ncbi:MAG: hypothetical protein EA399_00615 [Desulfovibrionales bacterium]|nr:MAG: hypothetical protein EA399_00615 [Desulfovibrionales bacterium]
MQTEAFDLNDIHNEPTDEQLQALMEDVAEEARRKRELAAIRQLEILRSEIEAVQRKWFPQ